MIDTSVPSPTFGPNGFIAPQESAVDAGVTTDIDAAFGGGLNPAGTTPQGQLATSTAAIIGNKNDQFVFYTTQTDPAYAEGRMQDGIARIYFLERKPALPTVVPGCHCIGTVGTVIPAGSLAQASDGNLYQALGGGTIDATGTLILDFQCLATGPIACPATSLNSVYRSVTGWDRITNPEDGVLGRNVEGRAAFETRRQQSVALNARGSLPAIRANVLDVANVLDAYVTENDTGGPVTVGGVVLSPNSLYVCVSGGDPAAVASAIWRKKGPGCAYTGVNVAIASIAATTLTVASVSYGAVAAGQAVLDRSGHVAAGTDIISGSGSTWTLSPSQTVASESMFLVDAAYTGVIVQDENPLLTPPYPSYVIAFRQASSLSILFAISIPNTTLVPANAQDLINAAILNAFSGEDGGPVPRIGGPIYASRFVAGITALGTWAQIISLQIGSANTPVTTGTASASGTTLTVSAAAANTIAVGQSVTGVNIDDGSIILQQLTGTAGGAGTYKLNQSQTAASAAVTFSSANQNSVTAQINQEPTLNFNNISLTLV